MADEKFLLKELSPDTVCSGLSLGAPEFAPLKIFLAKHAKRYHTQNAAKTYIVCRAADPCKAVAYITLVCSQIQVDPPDGLDGFPYKDFPAVKIARLAVDKRYRGNDLGAQLVDLAVAMSTEKIMPHIGCRFLAVDSKPGSIKFYEKQGFRLLDTNANRGQEHPLMFMDIGKLA